jgi:hypothetical protein
VAVVDRPLTGPEAAALYSERIQDLREHDARDRVVRNTVLVYLKDRGGRADLTEVIKTIDLPLTELVAVLNEMLAEGVIVPRSSNTLALPAPGEH